VELAAPDIGERYRFDVSGPPGRQPLLEAVFQEVDDLPAGALDVTVTTGVPPGCGTGTSAAVVVALLAALDALTPGTLGPDRLAQLAHRVETVRLGQQSGVQDQLASAHGGINLLDVTYPEATVHPVDVPAATRDELQQRLLLVSLGHPHRSTAIHEQVVAGLSASADVPALDVLRAAARRAAGAVSSGDLQALGAAMRTSTEAQRSLHPSLVSAQAQELIDRAADAGAAGWKVNGAGGDGGSLTLLAGAGHDEVDRLRAAVDDLAGDHEVLAIRLADHGVRVSGAATG
jgi:D-glycero-alpha-D-manno-heptose-7-phosphate kinase